MPLENGSPSNVIVFLYYFIPAILFIAIMLNRTVLLKFLLNAIDYVFDSIRTFVKRVDKSIINTLNRINNQEFIFL
jgi:hypothetical protein